MHQINLSDKLYLEAKSRAQTAGFASVEEFIAGLLQQDFSEADEDFDARFTPEVNAYLNRVSSEMAAGKSLSVREVEAHLDEARKAWRTSPAG